MALNKDALKADIRDILDTMSGIEDDPEAAREEFATRLANVIDTYVKTGTVSYTGGLTAGSTPVIGFINGNIS